MIKTNLFQGILIACGLSLASLPVQMALSGLGLSNHVVLAVLAFGYIVYLLANSTSPLGRATLGIGCFAILCGASVWGVSLPLTVMLAVGLIWTVRSLLTHRRLTASMLDGVLCLFSLACALTAAVLTRSLWLTVWSFFLPQALFVYLPYPRGAAPSTAQDAPDPQGRREHFARAHRAAEAALRVMTEPHRTPFTP